MAICLTRPISFSSRVRLLAFAAFAVGLSLALYFTRDPRLSAANAMLALLTIWCALAPGVAYFVRDSEKNATTPFMGLTGGFYAIFFGFSVFLAHFMYHEGLAGIYFYLNFYTHTHKTAYIPKISESAQVIVLAGIVLQLAAWQLVLSWKPRFTARFAPRPASRLWQTAVLAGVLSALFLMFLFLPQFRALPSVGQFVVPAGYVGFGLLFVLVLQKAVPRWLRWLFLLSTIPIWIASMVATGFLTPALLAVIYLAFLYKCVRRRFPWAAILLTLAIASALYPIMNRYRAYSWQYDKRQELGYVESRVSGLFAKVLLLAKVAGQIYLNVQPTESYVTDSKGVFLNQGFLQRTAGLVIFNYVYNKTPAEVPYWSGETYLPLLTSWIPRVFWKDKPREETGNKFANRYHIIDPSDRNISINLPWITELYANFGTLGVFGGMALAGFLLGLLERFFLHQASSSVGSVAGWGVLLPLFNQESNFSLMVGSLPMLTLCLWIYFSVGARLIDRFRMGVRADASS